jgi:hypothetical protein
VIEFYFGIYFVAPSFVYTGITGKVRILSQETQPKNLPLQDETQSRSWSYPKAEVGTGEI